MENNPRIYLVANQYPDPKSIQKSAGGLVDAVLSYFLDKEGIWLGAVRDVKREARRTIQIQDGQLTESGVLVDDSLHELHYVLKCNEGDWINGHEIGWTPKLRTLDRYLLENEDRLSHLSRFSRQQLARVDRSKPFYWQSPVYSRKSLDGANEVAKRFASRLDSEYEVDGSPEDSVIWVNDYQVISVGREMERLQGRKLKNLPRVYFHHIAVPEYKNIRKTIETSTEAAQTLDDNLEAILYYDAAGFQTFEHLENLKDTFIARKDSPIFRDNIQDIEKVREGVYKVKHKFGSKGVTYLFAQTIGVNPKPIIADVEDESPIQFELSGGGHRLEDLIEDCKNQGIPIIFGAERMDLTKGWFERSLIADNILAKGQPIMNVWFGVPTRVDIESYQRLRNMVPEMARVINNHYRYSNKGAIRDIYNSGYLPVYIEEEKIVRPDIHKVRKHVNEAAFSTRDGAHLVTQHIIADSVNQPEERHFTIVSEGCGVYESLAQFARTDHDGVVGIDPFDIDGSANKIIRAIRDPRNRHSQEVIDFVLKRNVDRWARYNIGFAMAASKGNNSVLDFLDKFDKTV
jgi:trehalose-6-phosphate synthase